jgi:hypothetical protein
MKNLILLAFCAMMVVSTNAFSVEVSNINCEAFAESTEREGKATASTTNKEKQTQIVISE